MPKDLTYELDEELQPQKRPKWTIPKLPWEIAILAAVGRKYYQDHQEKNTVVLIAKAVLPLSSGIESAYPTEWLQNCCDWARKKRANREMVGLLGLVHLIQNEDRKGEFVARFIKEHGRVESQNFLDDNEPSLPKGGFLDDE